MGQPGLQSEEKKEWGGRREEGMREREGGRGRKEIKGSRREASGGGQEERGGRDRGRKERERERGRVRKGEKREGERKKEGGDGINGGREREEERGRPVQIRLPRALHAGISTELWWECPGTLGLLYSLCGDSNLQPPGFRDRNSKHRLRTTQCCPHLSYKRKKKKNSSCG